MTRKTLIALALTLPATAALAQGPSTGVSWSYFDFGVQHTSPDEGDLDDGTGFGVRGSGAINDNWHVFLGWNRTPVEGERGFSGQGGVPGVVSLDDDFDRYHIGIGYNLPVAAATDLFARVAYERAGSVDIDVNVGGQNLTATADSTDGYSVEVGVRSAFTANFEAGASARYLSYDDPDVRLGDNPVDTSGLITEDSTTSLLLYGQYKFGNGWGIVGEGDINSEYKSLFVGARLSY